MKSSSGHVTGCCGRCGAGLPDLEGFVAHDRNGRMTCSEELLSTSQVDSSGLLVLADLEHDLDANKECSAS